MRQEKECHDKRRNLITFDALQLAQPCFTNYSYA